MDIFQELDSMDWQPVFFDPCTEDWTEHWSLDGLKATITHDAQGMSFSAGPVEGEDASHAVLWTKPSFEGSIKVEYEYTRLDDAVSAVNIIYLLASGSGVGPHDEDIAEWADERGVPSMRLYFNHMHTYHISYAAFNLDNDDRSQDYVRARRYLPERPEGLKGTDLPPDHFSTGLFQTGVPHQITLIKHGDELVMHATNAEQEQTFRWDTSIYPPITAGRIGLRHMWTRSSRYQDFKVSVLTVDD
ncbi:DUF1961 family protein [Algisphaera agarilytica]|uniref:DUF1961 family protein n=1 Tax=Algisphaera agarilytica TaxID=1385975 RepID=A0A7X0H4K7_9BACT|nr:DUF1961 family protein [Algisphaera agarilytica]MBB6429173.1 hypothetical protein [Algisphaera agarilytica]